MADDKKSNLPVPSPDNGTELLLYQSEDGQARIEVRLVGETLWLTQNQMAELFQVDKSGISRHLKNIFETGELSPESVVAEFATTAADGKTYQVEYYNLDAIISVGYRVNSLRGTQFRIWATQRLHEYLVKGFVMDDERLKNPGPDRPDYFDEILERIRDIRSSERRFYQNRRCWKFTRRAWTTIRRQKRRSGFSPRCRTRCIGPRTATRRRRSSTSAPTRRNRSWAC
jgi:hypothetical protein